MSLLRKGNELVKVFQQVATVEYDSDGNRVSRPALIGTLHRASVQPISATENADGGYNTTTKYRLRLVNHQGVIGPRSQVEWNGERYSIEGDGMVHNGSRRTAHVTYVMTRA
jgi:hypothetical protein